MHKLHLVSITWNALPFKVEEADAVAGTLGDWVRLNSLSWIVWSDKDIRDIVVAFRAKLAVEDMLIVLPIQPSIGAGFAPQWVWDWINHKMLVQLKNSP